MLTVARTLISYSTSIKERSQIMVNFGISNTVGFFVGSGGILHIIRKVQSNMSTSPPLRNRSTHREQNEFGPDTIGKKQTYKGNLLFWKGTQCKGLFKSCCHGITWS